MISSLRKNPKSINIKSATLELLQQYRESKDIRFRNEIVTLNIGLVLKEAHHWSKRCNETFDDLKQVGSLGLLRAVERFSIERGNAFSSFASPFIRGEIQHYLRDKSSTTRLPRRILQLRQKSNRFIEAFQHEYNRQPSATEIAQHLEISVAEWHSIKLDFQNRSPISLDLAVTSSQGKNTCLGDLIPDPSYKSFQLAIEDQIRIQQALAQLEEHTRTVIEFVFLHDLTRKEAAELLGISAITVSRRIKKGIEAMRNVLSND